MSARIGVKTRKLLWMRSGGVCAHPGCDEPLEEPIPGGDSSTITSIECHIVAQQDSPVVARSPSSLTDDEQIEFADLIENRHGLNNLVVMCTKHARLIDDPKRDIRVAEVVAMKKAHEASVRTASSPADANVLRLSAIVDDWEERVNLDEWAYWLGGVFGNGHPQIQDTDLVRLADARRWMFSRVWPPGATALEASFENFRYVAQDLELCLRRYPYERFARRGIVSPVRFYNDDGWAKLVGFDYPRLDELYEWWANLLEDLALELTRAGNLVCEAVRQTLDPGYRLDLGLLTLESGPYTDGRTRLHRPRYASNSGWSPYPGVQQFVSDRQTRDECRGSGPVPPELSIN